MSRRTGLLLDASELSGALGEVEDEGLVEGRRLEVERLRNDLETKVKSERFRSGAEREAGTGKDVIRRGAPQGTSARSVDRVTRSARRKDSTSPSEERAHPLGPSSRRGGDAESQAGLPARERLVLLVELGQLSQRLLLANLVALSGRCDHVFVGDAGGLTGQAGVREGSNGSNASAGAARGQIARDRERGTNLLCVGHAASVKVRGWAGG